MTLEEIKVLIQGDETRTLELKKTTSELKDEIRSICAFLNTSGGWLLFGITPKTLKITGQMVSDNTRKEIAHELTKIEPAISAQVDYIDIDGKCDKYIIALHADVNLYKDAPYVYDGRPYYRVEVENSGTLPEGISLEDLMKPHPSHAPNPLIAQVMYFGKYLETWGRGIELMQEECEAVNVAAPKFSIGAGCFRVIFQRPDYKTIQLDDQSYNKKDIQGDTTRGHNRGYNRGTTRGYNKGTTARLIRNR